MEFKIFSMGRHKCYYGDYPSIYDFIKNLAHFSFFSNSFLSKWNSY